MSAAARSRISYLLVALLVSAAIAGFVLRAPLEHRYALHALREATGLNVEARGIERSGNVYVLHDLVAWTHGGAYVAGAPLARIDLARSAVTVELAHPRFVVAPERIRGDERAVLRSGTLRFSDGTLSVVGGVIPEPIFAFDRFSGTMTDVARLRYDAHIELLAAGGRFPIDVRSTQRADGTFSGNWHASQLPLATLGALGLQSALLRPTSGWLRDVDVSTGTSLHASARLDDAAFSLDGHALAAMHGALVFDRNGIGTRDLAGVLDGSPVSVAGEVHDLSRDPSWLRNGSRNLRSLGRLLAAIAATPQLRSVRLEATAPGLAFAQYALATEHGPLAISVMAIDPSEPTLRFDAELAEDHVISGGERTSALGLRTGAVAGVNGDYFDIGKTYQPQGLVLRDGELVRGPTDRAALVIDRAKRVTFAEFHLRGEVRTPHGNLPITELNDSPPGRVSVITPAFGKTLHAAPGCTFVALRPLGPGERRYRVTDVVAMTQPLDVRFGLAIGPLVKTRLPVRGETIELRYRLEPHVADAIAGIGGGPILIRGGRWYEDPHAPAPDERNVRWPVIALATQADGTLLMVALDGRHPERSIGATRPEFAVILQRLGAVDAMALDSGGSVTLVDRAIGDANVSVRNVPSDFSAERWISDGLFLYSSAAPPTIVPPTGAPTPRSGSASDAMIAPVLPQTLAVPAPFPQLVSQAMTQRAIAPGISRATYDLLTSAGPLVVQVVAIDPHDPAVRLGSVVAGDRLVSAGESVSSMARRTGAVAGINADYFDIGQTNQPLNVVVRDGTLLRSPSKRIALDVRRDRSIRFENFTFAGTASYGAATVPLASLNEWPPQGGAGLITSDYGPLRAAPGVRIAELEPISTLQDGTPSGVYRVTATGGAGARLASGVALAFGPAALALAAPPLPGDTVTLQTTLSPSQTDLVAAVGGGPLLVQNGVTAVDPNAPAPEERDVRFPVSGAAVTAAGTLLFLTVDGRQRSVSIGVTRPEFGALMLGLGATDGMAFDSGGSATLVARELGDTLPSVANVPSDGEERPVADGLFVYSDAPLGPPAALAVLPAPIVALAGVDVPVRLAVVDAAGHALGPAHLAGGDVVRGVVRSTVVTLRASGLQASVPVRIVPSLARLDVSSDARVVQPGATVTLRAVGRDASGVAVELGDRVRWSADRGAFAAPGHYRANARDARIVARVGTTSATYALHVGSHALPVDAFDNAHAAAWTFASAPRGAGGSLAIDPAQATLSLAYDFTAGARAAYASASLALPGEPLSFRVDVRGDASGVGLRAAFVNVFGERRALTLAKSVDWNGWQSREIALPDDLNPPVRFVSLYAVPSLGAAPVHAAGSLGFRNLGVVVAGSP